MMQSLGGGQQPPQQQQQSFGNFQQGANNNTLNQNHQQQQQNQPQHLNNNGNGNNTAQNGGGSQDAASSSQPEYTLAGILHYLQTEWRRYEKDRNEWEIERAEMRARIALLEGERRGGENLKTDLMRRVKMLEYALRQERSKYLSGSSTVGPLKNPAVSGLEKEATTLSGRSSPSLQDSDPNLAGIHLRNASSFSLASLAGGASSTFTLPHKPASAKDHLKSRDKSRDYLKQCLQEISYLTSQDVLNPLPDRAFGNSPSAASEIPRPRKDMQEAPPLPKGNTNTFLANRPSSLANDALAEADETTSADQGHAGSTSSSSSSLAGHPTGKQAPRPPSPQPYSTDPEATPSSSGNDGALPVFRSTGGADDWKALKEAGEVQRAKRDRERRRLEDGGEVASSGDDSFGDSSTATEKLQHLMRQGTVRAPGGSRLRTGTGENDDEQDDDDIAAAAAVESERLWKLKSVLRSQRKSIMALAFDAVGPILFSASENGITASLVDAQSMQQHTQAPATSRGTASAPSITFTGHANTVNALAVASARGRLYSGSQDKTIRIWNLSEQLTRWRGGSSPNADGEDGSPEKPTQLESFATITTPSEVRHLSLLPSWAGEDALLVTASTDGRIGVYDASGEQAQEEGASQDALRFLYDFDYFGSEPPTNAEEEREQLRQDFGGLPYPTDISVVHSNTKQFAVSWSNSIVKLYSIEGGVCELTLKLDQTLDGAPATGINTIVSHSTLPLLFSGHDDKFIKVTDLRSGQIILSMHGHRDSVVSLDIDPAGLQLLSGGYDGTIRVWDMSVLTKRFTGGIDEEAKSKPKEKRDKGGDDSNNDDGDNEGDDNDDDDDDDDDDVELVCIQEFKDTATGNEGGITALRYHRTMPFFATGGRSGSIGIYG